EIARNDDVYEGVWVDQSGARILFSADALPTGAETEVETPEGKTFILLTISPFGVRMSAIPYDDTDDLIINRAASLSFLRAGVELPPTPKRYVAPPQSPGGTIDPAAFVESYAFWPSASVGYGYEMVRGRYRTLIRLHAVVQTDILWKMCKAQTAPAAMADALRGQGVTCQDVLANVGRMLKAGEPFTRFKADSEAQKIQLVEAIRCSIDYRRNDPECKASGARVAQAAVSMQTVRGVLSRY
ncbi:MAG: hypothetical protein ACPGFA_12840, partial [Pikeienuella sp.]